MADAGGRTDAGTGAAIGSPAPQAPFDAGLSDAGIAAAADASVGPPAFDAGCAPLVPAPVLVLDQEATTAVASGDLNGDGLPDLVLAGPDTTFSSPSPLEVLLGEPDGGFSLSLLDRAAIHGAQIADVDGDGLPDIVASAAGGLLVYFNAGGARFGAPVLFEGTATEGLHAFAVADVDGSSGWRGRARAWTPHPASPAKRGRSLLRGLGGACLS